MLEEPVETRIDAQPEDVGRGVGARSARLSGALEELPPKLRVLVVLKDVYGLSHEEIAEELGISVAAAKVRLHRGRKRLRDLLYEDEPQDGKVGPCSVTTSPGSCPRRSSGGAAVELSVQRHIESCLRCQAELARYRRMLRGLQLLRTRYLEPAPGLLAQTLAAIEEAGERQAVHSILSGRRLAYAGAIGGAAVAAGTAADGDDRPPFRGGVPSPPRADGACVGPGPPPPGSPRVPRTRCYPCVLRPDRARRAVAQLVEHRSPKPAVGGSSPSCPAAKDD